MNRTEEWRQFSEQVEKHIEQYANVQYGNESGTDQATNFTIEECFQHILRYTNRRHSKVRGNKEALRDVLKIAHYACFIYNKTKVLLEEDDVYES